MSSTGEPEVVLRQQLEFVHNQIIFILTSQVQDILSANPSRDLRELLGPDTNRLIQSSCCDTLTPPCVVFGSVRGFVMESSLRFDLLSQLKSTLHGSNAAYVF